MMEGLAYLREMNVASVLLRLTVAMLFGGFIGLERERKRRPAGFRTYMLVCLGAALTMLLSQYESYMVTHAWHETAMEIGLRTDVSRFGAQVINGIGFLGAGTIIVTGKQEVKGLTTAAGLWASACMGLAIGAGFYECVLLGFLLILLTNRLLPFVEDAIIESARNMNICGIPDAGQSGGHHCPHQVSGRTDLRSGSGPGPGGAVQESQRGVLHSAARQALPRPGPGGDLRVGERLHH